MTGARAVGRMESRAKDGDRMGDRLAQGWPPIVCGTSRASWRAQEGAMAGATVGRAAALRKLLALAAVLSLAGVLLVAGLLAAGACAGDVRDEVARVSNARAPERPRTPAAWAA